MYPVSLRLRSASLASAAVFMSGAALSGGVEREGRGRLCSGGPGALCQRCRDGEEGGGEGAKQGRLLSGEAI